MREPWTWGSRVAVVLALGGLIVAAAGCASLGSRTPTSSRAGSGASASSSSPSPSPLGTPSPAVSSTVTPPPPAGGAVTISSQNNGSTVVLQVGQELVVDLPSGSTGVSGTESATSSDLAVLRSLAADQPGSGIETLRQLPFKALSIGTATLTATGEDPFSVQVEVVAS